MLGKQQRGLGDLQLEVEQNEVPDPSWLRYFKSEIWQKIADVIVDVIISQYY